MFVLSQNIYMYLMKSRLQKLYTLCKGIIKKSNEVDALLSLAITLCPRRSSFNLTTTNPPPPPLALPSCIARKVARFVLVLRLAPKVVHVIHVVHVVILPILACFLASLRNSCGMRRVFCSTTFEMGPRHSLFCGKSVSR